MPRMMEFNRRGFGKSLTLVDVRPLNVMDSTYSVFFINVYCLPTCIRTSVNKTGRASSVALSILARLANAYQRKSHTP